MGGGCSSGQVQSTLAPEREAATEVAIFWDIENLAPQRGAAAAVATRLREAAVRAAPSCALTAFHAYVDTTRLAEGQLAALTEQGVTVIHSVTNPRKRAEASDKALTMGLLLWLWERGPRAAAVVLVTADHDFAPLLAKLADSGRIGVVLVAPLSGPREISAARLGAGKQIALEDWNEVCTRGAAHTDGAARETSVHVDAPLRVPSVDAAGALASPPPAQKAGARARGGRGREPGGVGLLQTAGAQQRGATPALPADVPSAENQQQLHRARELLAGAGEGGILRSAFQERFTLAYGQPFALPSAAGNKHKLGLGATLKRHHVALLLDGDDNERARFVALAPRADALALAAAAHAQPQPQPPPTPLGPDGMACA
jgi:hypothetical protein